MIVDMEEANYSYDRLKEDAIKLTEQYNRIINYVTIGVSHDNRDIIMLKLGMGRKHLLFCAGVHGRESINPIVLMAMTEYYGSNYQKYARLRAEPKDYSNKNNNQDIEFYNWILFGKCIFELLQTYTILIIPLLNPDGYMISLQGYSVLQNEAYRELAQSKAISYEEWKYNGRSVDINRNFPCRLWNVKGPGDYAASENETKALISVFHQYRIKGFIDLHSRGKCIYYYRRKLSNMYNERQKAVALRLKELTKYELVAPEEEIDPGDTGGNTVHYFSEHFFKLALTIETIPEEAEFPLDIKYRASTFEELKLLFFELGSLMA